MAGEYDFHTDIKEDWGGGEIAPSWRGRISSQAYKSGSALIYNMLPRSGGGLRRRPGTRFVATPGFDNNIVKLIGHSCLYGQQFMLAIGRVASTATIKVYSMATHAFVANITTNVPAYALADIPAITYAKQNGQTWLFMAGTAGGTSGGTPVCIVSNANADGSGAWSASQPSFTNADSGGETFSAVNHYPGAGEFYAGRIFLTGINVNPTAQWGCNLPAPGSAQGYNVFTVGTAPTAASGIFLQQNDMDAPAIRALFAATRMLALTDRSVWAENPENYPTYATYSMFKSATWGSLPYVRPVQVKNVVLYLGSEAKSLRSLIYSLQRGYFADDNLSEHAEHLMSRGAVDFCITLKPDPTAWVVMADGSLVSATVRQEDQGFVVKAGCGFAQHRLGGGSSTANVVAIGQLTNVNYDEVWFAVNRGATQSIEYLYLDDINSTTQTGSFYVDCGATLSGPLTTFTGLPSPLSNQKVYGLGDGAVQPPTVASGTSVTYQFAVTTLNVGFGYYSAYQGLIPMLPAKGSSFGKMMKIEYAWMYVYNSMGGYIGTDPPTDPLNYPEAATSSAQGGTLDNFWRDMQTYGVQLAGGAPGWVNGFFPIQVPGAARRDCQIYIDIADPVPFNLVGLTARYAISEV